MRRRARTIGFDAYRQRRTPLIYADPGGQFPITRAQIARGDVLALTEQIAIMSQKVLRRASQGSTSR